MAISVLAGLKAWTRRLSQTGIARKMKFASQPSCNERRKITSLSQFAEQHLGSGASKSTPLAVGSRSASISSFRPTRQATPLPLSDRACRSLRRTSRRPERAVRGPAATCHENAKGAPYSSPHAAPKILLVVDEQLRARARSRFPLLHPLAVATRVRFPRQCDAPRPRTIFPSTLLLCLSRRQCNAEHHQSGQFVRKPLPNTTDGTVHKVLRQLPEVR